ncbi:hypothetical protein [Cyanobium sp. Morenito 9A2]|uniref:hypothetical protein n=1 Tax=Cyanobium sp. Morenito 9A2 TaxID=2823718 RepID=UPI0020CB8103|nr:hypothetical protein [Cyanobium sp. Morenito 9A2]MCP9850753.1 hypothetical protein [Cyanobium sp. Morenito 9A2]
MGRCSQDERLGIANSDRLPEQQVPLLDDRRGNSPEEDLRLWRVKRGDGRGFGQGC